MHVMIPIVRVEVDVRMCVLLGALMCGGLCALWVLGTSHLAAPSTKGPPAAEVDKAWLADLSADATGCSVKDMEHFILACEPRGIVCTEETAWGFECHGKEYACGFFDHDGTGSERAEVMCFGSTPAMATGKETPASIESSKAYVRKDGRGAPSAPEAL